jgi:hypothetical protein
MTVRTFPWAYIIHADNPSERLEFQIFPEEISMNKAAEYASVPVVGRSEPVRSYSSSGPKTFSFELQFVASVEQGDDGDTLYVLEKVAWLESLVYPEYENNLTFPPPVVFLMIGDAIQARCITTEVNPTYSGPWDVYESEHGSTFNWISPMRATVSLTLEEVSLVPSSSSFIRGGGTSY